MFDRFLRRLLQKLSLMTLFAAVWLHLRGVTVIAMPLLSLSRWAGRRAFPRLKLRQRRRSE